MSGPTPSRRAVLQGLGIAGLGAAGLIAATEAPRSSKASEEQPELSLASAPTRLNPAPPVLLRAALTGQGPGAASSYTAVSGDLGVSALTTALTGKGLNLISAGVVHDGSSAKAQFVTLVSSSPARQATLRVKVDTGTPVDSSWASLMIVDGSQYGAQLVWGTRTIGSTEIEVDLFKLTSSGSTLMAQTFLSLSAHQSLEFVLYADEEAQTVTALVDQGSGLDVISGMQNVSWPGLVVWKRQALLESYAETPSLGPSGQALHDVYAGAGLAVYPNNWRLPAYDPNLGTRFVVSGMDTATAPDAESIAPADTTGFGAAYLSTNWSAYLASWQKGFARARDNGANIVRMWRVCPDITFTRSPAVVPYVSQADMFSRIDDFVAAAAAAGLWTIVCASSSFPGSASDPHTTQNLNITMAEFQSWLTALAAHLESNPNVVAMDICNEMTSTHYNSGGSTGASGPTFSLSDISTLLSAVRTAAPSLPLTASSSANAFSNGFGASVPSGVDFVDNHIYYDAAVSDTYVLTNHTTQPVMVCEYGGNADGAHNGFPGRSTLWSTVQSWLGQYGFAGALAWEITQAPSSTYSLGLFVENSTVDPQFGPITPIHGSATPTALPLTC
ncbi:cellulase family glycosylhydrolase [Jatrophihabitans sp.]|uniref:cellulase family glycosylhydrolase n=1 Tax=Jatrophihabitans sp. TaxID=1932789 RepID=UPI0030C6B752|nr:hypothetical protein [Jatrophihabitans sp.]